MDNLQTFALVITTCGLIGIVEFAGMALSARVLGDTVVPRLRRRIDSPLVRHSRLLALISAGVLAVGLVLLAH